MSELAFMSIILNVLLIGWIVLTYFIDFRETQTVKFLDKENQELLDKVIKLEKEVKVLKKLQELQSF